MKIKVDVDSLVAHCMAFLDLTHNHACAVTTTLRIKWTTNLQGNPQGAPEGPVHSWRAPT